MHGNCKFTVSFQTINFNQTTGDCVDFADEKIRLLCWFWSAELFITISDNGRLPANVIDVSNGVKPYFRGTPEYGLKRRPTLDFWLARYGWDEAD